MSAKRILITGGSSYLGQHLVPLAAASPHTIGYTFYQNDPLQLPQGIYLNMCDRKGVLALVEMFRPDVIIHTVGSNRTDNLDAVIRLGTIHITEAAAASKARLIHISTDAIFDGKSPPYNERAVPSPIHTYGKAKAAAEAIVVKHPNHVIVRTSLIYGLKLIDQGTAWMAAILRAGKPVRLFNNQIRNPVWAETLSQACLELAVSTYRGVLNVAGQQAMTRSAFALKMLDWWQVRARETLTIGPAAAENWPLDCTLNVQRATAVLTTPLWGVDDVLDRARNNHRRPSSS